MLTLQGPSRSAIIISTHPRFCRAVHTAAPFGSSIEPSKFVLELRKKLANATLDSIEQVGFDRILRIRLRTPEATHSVVAELTGRHANILLLDHEDRLVIALKSFGGTKSPRPLIPGKPYVAPPGTVESTPWETYGQQEFDKAASLSPFLLELLQAGGAAVLNQIRLAASEGEFQPVEVDGLGTYPISVKPLGLDEHAIEQYSPVAERYFSERELQEELEQLRSVLVARLKAVLLARNGAIRELEEAATNAELAGSYVWTADMILAMQYTTPHGASELQCEDTEGNIVKIPLDPTLSLVENAEVWYRRAKKAKRSKQYVLDRLDQIRSDQTSIESVLQLVERAQTLQELQSFQRESFERGWLHKQPLPIHDKEKRPYHGHSIRELTSPAGWTVLYGENSTSNDYLTTKVAKPSDWWLHVRGASSAHVILVTKNQPNKVQKADLLFAARVAVQHSPTKHSAYVSVDYTLKKYVRKPRGAGPGTVVYEREKTIIVD